MRLVVKYAGGVITPAENLRIITRHLAGLSAEHQVVVVVSAVGDTTDKLQRMSDMIRAEDRHKVGGLVRDIMGVHDGLARELINDNMVLERLLVDIGTVFEELRALIDGLMLLGDMTPRSVDYLLSFGERLATILLTAALADEGVRGISLTGKDAGILTDSEFGHSQPLMDTTRLRVSKRLGKVFEDGSIPVLGGYSGADQHGRVTTFGRGGSDYTATIVGACIGADQIWLMGEMDGVTTADPHLVGDARVLNEISYTEAIEMSMFGAKQIHPRTFEPVLEANILLRIRSATNTTHPGTLVVPASKNTVKCVSALRGNGLIDIQSFGMVGSPGTAAGIFSTLARAAISVMMISQNPSESGITIVLKNTDLHKAVHFLELEHLGKLIKRLTVTSDVAVVALIGAGLRGTVGTAARVFEAVRSMNINVMMITQGSSEINLAFVVKDSDVMNTVKAIHKEFSLAENNHLASQTKGTISGPRT